MAYLYIHKTLDTNIPFYIGIGSTKNYNRAFTKHSRTKFWKHEVQKHGLKIEILLDNLTWENACKEEIEFIKLYGRRDLGKGTLVNLTDGGEGTIGIVRSKESIIKMIKSRGVFTHSDETKRKMSISHKGKSKNKGRIQSKEEKEIRSKSMIGKNKDKKLEKYSIERKLNHSKIIKLWWEKRKSNKLNIN